MAALPVIPERAALVATLLADLAALAATAATVGRLMAAARLVAMAVPEFCLVMAALRAVTAARRSEEMAAAEKLAAEVLAATVGSGGADVRAPWAAAPRTQPA